MGAKITNELARPHYQGHFNVISSSILSLDVSDLGRDWEEDGDGDQRHSLCFRKAGWSGGQWGQGLWRCRKEEKKMFRWDKIRN